ncbi:hypothetical protein [Klebsiella pneumoniae]|uniref:hypothetical protein n=1 Tax=Klebsiella pneumoniae TaxID=573 RepID=UPI00355752A9
MMLGVTIAAPGAKRVPSAAQLHATKFFGDCSAEISRDNQAEQRFHLQVTVVFVAIAVFLVGGNRSIITVPSSPTV